MVDFLGYPPRMQAYLVALDLSEVINYVRVPPDRRAALDRFADGVWSIVEKLDRFAASTSLRSLATVRAAVNALFEGAAGLGLEGPSRAIVQHKLEGIRAALDAVAAAEAARKQRMQ
jgi:hypothetical protein